MKRTSLWAIVVIREMKRGIVRARGRRMAVVFWFAEDEGEDGEEVVKALNQPTTANGRDVVSSKGSPSVR